MRRDQTDGTAGPTESGARKHPEERRRNALFTVIGRDHELGHPAYVVDICQNEERSE